MLVPVQLLIRYPLLYRFHSFGSHGQDFFLPEDFVVAKTEPFLQAISVIS